MAKRVGRRPPPRFVLAVHPRSALLVHQRDRTARSGCTHRPDGTNFDRRSATCGAAARPVVGGRGAIAPASPRLRRGCTRSATASPVDDRPWPTPPVAILPTLSLEPDARAELQRLCLQELDPDGSPLTQMERKAKERALKRLNPETEPLLQTDRIDCMNEQLHVGQRAALHATGLGQGSYPRVPDSAWLSGRRNGRLNRGQCTHHQARPTPQTRPWAGVVVHLRSTTRTGRRQRARSRATDAPEMRQSAPEPGVLQRSPAVRFPLERAKSCPPARCGTCPRPTRRPRGGRCRRSWSRRRRRAGPRPPRPRSRPPRRPPGRPCRRAIGPPRAR